VKAENAPEKNSEARVRAERAKKDADREQQRKVERTKTDAQKKAESAKAEERRIAEGRRQEERKRAERRREGLRKEFEQRAQNAKSAAEKETARRQSLRQAEDRKKADAVALEEDRKRTRAADIRRRAEAALAERQKRQKAEKLEEHRRQTDHVRSLHRSETQSFKENEAAAIVKHAQEIQSINDAEQQALQTGAARRGSLVGRAVALVRGGKRRDHDAEAISEHYERERMSKHRDLEALKERQFAAAQQARLRQAQERKAIFELHRIDRQKLTQAHARSRATEVGMSQRAFERSAQPRKQARNHFNDRSRDSSR
jgi:hypothetical protein